MSRTDPKLNTPTDLASNAAKSVADTLNGILADSYAIYLKTKNFHWHVSGPHFRDYHLLLDEQAADILATTDEIAERVRKIGNTTLRSIGDGRLWVKLSAPYRLKGADPQQYVDALLRAGAQERLVWATDWPFVKFERAVSYAQCVAWIHQWLPDEALRNKVLAHNPHGIFTFKR